MAERNPFTPSFGVVPAFLAGRDAALSEMSDAFANGLGDPNLATVIVGARGSGKTALLSCIGNEAREAGWIVSDVIACRGMLEEALERASAEASELIEPESRRRLSGLGIGQLLSVAWDIEEPVRPGWRTRMDALLAVLAEKGVGLLITVDEIDPSVDELVQLVSYYQLFVRDRRQVALVMAGLPKNATDLVDDKRITFLRRARKRYLGRIGDAEIGRAIRRSFESTGKTIPENLLAATVSASDGWPYMMQLVGYNVWAESIGSDMILKEHVDRGIAAARAEFEENVLRSTLRDLSAGDLRFARAMLADDGPSRITDVAERMGKGANYASTYKSRLLKHGVISEYDNGTFAFCIPLFREFLSECEK